MRTCLLLILMILTVSSITSFCFLVRPAESTEGDWWNPAWIHRRELNITERSGYPVLDFPVEVTFEHYGNAQPDGRDIRVIENSTELPYHIIEMNDSWATIMFKVSLDSLSSKNLSVYYGNSYATTPSYPLVPLLINEGQQNGNATIDNRIFIGWNYVAWGVQPGWYWVGGNLVYIDNNPVVLWTDFRLDFNDDGVFGENEDLITDFDLWKGGIGRYHMGMGNYVERSYGLGDYQGFVRTPVYVELIFQDVTLRVYEGYSYVETSQADRLQMESTSWDYASYQCGSEENIIDGLDTNGPPEDPKWNTMCNSSISPGWMACRNSLNGYVFGAIGFDIDTPYMYHFSNKESHAFDRLVYFDYTTEQVLDPHDQPSVCKIYWYADGSNGYSEINKTASILSNPPLVSVFIEETIPEFPSFLILPLFMLATSLAVIAYRRKHLSRNA